MNKFIEFQKSKEILVSNKEAKEIEIPIQNHVFDEVIDTVELKDGFLMEIRLYNMGKTVFFITADLYHKTCRQRVSCSALVQPVRRIVKVAEIWKRVFESVEDQLEPLMHQYKEAFMVDKPAS